MIMDDPKQPLGESALSLAGPQGHAKPRPEGSAAFVPLRLFLLPAGKVFEVTQPEALVGRHSEADICLRLPDVSRRHCRLVFADNCWQVFDLQSLNGLFVNGRRVPQATLKHKDTVRLGSLTFEVDLHPGPATLQLPGDHSRTGGQNSMGGGHETLPRRLPNPEQEKLAS